MRASDGCLEVQCTTFLVLDDDILALAFNVERDRFLLCGILVLRLCYRLISALRASRERDQSPSHN